MPQAQSQAAGAGVDLARRMILAYCDEGDRGALNIINGAESELELGYACSYLLSALAEFAHVVTGSRKAALALLRDSAPGVLEDAVLTELRALLDGGES